MNLAGSFRKSVIHESNFLSEQAAKQYTLVLDLDETLVHYVTSEKKFKLRPGCLWFLKEMSKTFEIIVFTAAAKDYADFILDIIEKRVEALPDSTLGGKVFSHRLYRTNCLLENGVYVKDLSKLGRALERTIIVDNIRDNFNKQPENGIEILTWVGDPADRELQRLAAFLKEMVRNRITDVRHETSKFKT